MSMLGRPPLDDFTPDMRRMRTEQFVAEVMRVVSPYICDPDARGREEAEVYRRLIDHFWTVGIDFVSDHIRAQVGLPLRNDRGWTPQELRVMEDLRIEAMMRPVRPILPEQK